MKPIKILLVEDELITAKNMQAALEERGYVITDIATSKEAALRAIEIDQPGIILMDIGLKKGKTEGIATAKSINQHYSIPIIYITQLQDEAIFLKAKETFPKNYISKPFSDHTLFHAIEIALQDYQNSKKTVNTIETKVSDGIFVQIDECESVKLLFSDILYIKSGGPYCYIYFEVKDSTQEHSYRFSQSSNNLVERLGYPALIKVHKSFYVNMHRIEGTKNAKIIIRGTSETISIGRGEFKENFFKCLKLLKHNPGQK